MPSYRMRIASKKPNQARLHTDPRVSIGQIDLRARRWIPSRSECIGECESNVAVQPSDQKSKVQRCALGTPGNSGSGNLKALVAATGLVQNPCDGGPKGGPTEPEEDKRPSSY